MGKIGYLVVPVLAVLALSLTALSPKAQASGSNSSSSTSSCMNNGVRPSPYTGGADVARVFYPPDGSTITITTTGAVIKQSPCETPYRQGWINPANTCSLNSAADLAGQIKPGATNPFTTSSNRTPGCATTSSSTTKSSSSVTTTSSSSKTVVAASTTHPTTSTTTHTTSTTTTLPNTGPGNVLALGGVSTILGTAGHFFYTRLRRA